jgi:protein-L-isoaspartate O-methyltransferase
MTDWQSRAAAMAAMVERITRSAELRTPLWQQAFRVVPRHCFVPVYYTCDVLHVR